MWKVIPHFCCMGLIEVSLCIVVIFKCVESMRTETSIPLLRMCLSPDDKADLSDSELQKIGKTRQRHPKNSLD